MKKTVILTVIVALLLAIPSMGLTGGRHFRHFRPHYSRGSNKVATAVAFVALVNCVRRSLEQANYDCYQSFPGAPVVCEQRTTYYYPPHYLYPCR